jgi:hypothetical protein
VPNNSWSSGYKSDCGGRRWASCVGQLGGARELLHIPALSFKKWKENIYFQNMKHFVGNFAMLSYLHCTTLNSRMIINTNRFRRKTRNSRKIKEQNFIFSYFAYIISQHKAKKYIKMNDTIYGHFGKGTKTGTKLRMYSITPKIVLCNGSECWIVNKSDARKNEYDSIYSLFTSILLNKPL